VENLRIFVSRINSDQDWITTRESKLQIRGFTVSDRVATDSRVIHSRLALKMVATSIQDLFAGDIAQFLQQGSVAFNGIGHLL
jgi:hypothetical protein